MRRDSERERATLLDIVSSAEITLSRMSGRTATDLGSDLELQDMVLFRLLVIGEATKRLPEEVMAEIPSVPWIKEQGMRNRVIHGYDEVDFGIVWETVQVHLPPLIDAVRQYLASRSQQP